MKLAGMLLLLLIQTPAPGPVPSSGQGPGPVPAPRGARAVGAPVPLSLAEVAAPVGVDGTPIHFDCLSSDPAQIVMRVDWNEYPFDSLKLIFETLKPSSTDKTAPVISGVVAGLVNVLGNAGKIAPASNGTPFNVSAGDDVAITHAGLFVDGSREPAATSKDPAGLPTLFYLRWNARVVAPGQHTFRLAVWDAAGNTAEKTWVMYR